MASLGRTTRGGVVLLQFIAAWVFCWIVSGGSALALDAADMAAGGSHIDLTPYFARAESDARSVSMAMPQGGGDGETLTLQAAGAGPRFVWLVAVVSNRGTAARSDILALGDHGFAGSGLLWPASLTAAVANVTANGPGTLQPLAGQEGRAWQLDLPAGKSTVVVVELAHPDSAARFDLWQRPAYDSHVAYVAFFRGALLGIVALLTIGLLAVYALRSRPVYLAAGGFALASLAFMLLDGGHLATLLASLGLPDPALDVARAAIESLMVTAVLFLIVTGGELRSLSPVAVNVALAFAAVSLALPFYGAAEPLIAAGVARFAFAGVALAGFAVALVQWQRGNDKVEAALMCFAALVLWAFLALTVALAGGNQAALSAVLLVCLAGVLVLITFTLARQAFAQGYLAPHLFRDAGRRALALAGARAYVWDWQTETGHLYLADEFDGAIGLQPGLLAEAGIDGFLELMHPVDRAAYLAAVDVAERQGNGLIACDFRLRHGDGSYRWFELRGRAMRGHGRRAARCIGTLTDVTDAKLSEERLLSDAVYDVVTGLPNRALFLDRLARATALAQPGDPDGVYVLLIDIDRFKTVNEALGHEHGDALLTIIGRRLSVETTPADSVARMPGDQFAVLYAGHGSRDIANFAEALQKAVARPISLEGQEVFLTASVGIAQFREAGLSGEQILKDAAIALYEAKRRGAGGIEVFDVSMRDDRAELVVLEAELRRAIERNEIEVHYQPIARLADMNLAGFEALARWRHPTLGLLAPESFIGLAEQTGMIKDIGLVVLDEAVRQLGIWQRAFLPAEPLFVAVNISSAQLLETELIDDIKIILHREGIRRESLKIEVTESLLMQFPERAGQILERIRELGVGLACDDFGTGYSSLSSLRKLPFDTLKVDRSFIAADGHDDRASVILEAITALAHALGLAIVAEGIEDQDQVDRLGLLGCDFGQGYFIGKALTAKQVGDALAGLPYALSNGRTAITWLWERTARDPAPEPQPLDVTADGIAEARAREAFARQGRERRFSERLNAARTAVLNQPAHPAAARHWSFDEPLGEPAEAPRPLSFTPRERPTPETPAPAEALPAGDEPGPADTVIAYDPAPAAPPVEAAPAPDEPAHESPDEAAAEPADAVGDDEPTAADDEPEDAEPTPSRGVPNAKKASRKPRLRKRGRPQHTGKSP